MVGLLAAGLRDRRAGPAWLGWGAMVWGATLSDWLDGPLARHAGTAGDLGRPFDLEADSLLTLCAV